MDPKEIAKKFATMYYQAFSENRHELLQFYLKESQVTWNGQLYAGIQQISENLQSMKTTKLRYDYADHDAQITADNKLLILVNGYLSIDGAPPLPFSHTFLLICAGESSNYAWYIQNELFKFIFIS